jgi:hypothetical protein
VKVKTKMATGGLVLLMSSPVFAGPLSLTVEGRLQNDSTYNSSNQSLENQVNSASIKATLALREGVKAVIQMNFAELINNGSIDSSDLESMIEEAYIEVDAAGRATIIVGKHHMAFAQDLAQMAIPENDQRWALANEREMIGITIQLPQDTLGIIGTVIDSLEVSAFETGAGDLDIARTVGGSFRATRAFSERVQAAVSGLVKQHEGSDNEYRAAISVTYAADNGWVFFAEGQFLHNNPTYPDAAYAVTAGASREMGPGTIVLQGSFVENNDGQLGLSYHLPVSQSVTLSPEIRYNTGSRDVTVAARVTIQGQVYKQLNGQMPGDGDL